MKVGVPVLIRFALLFSLLIASCVVGAAEGTLTKNGVTVALSIEAHGTEGVLVGVFTPDPAFAKPLHLYAIDLPPGGAGIATKLALPAGSPLVASGPLAADQTTHIVAELPVYPPGPVTIRLPVHLPLGDGSPIAVPVLVSYLACTPDSCLVPVLKAPVTVTVPTVAGAPKPASVPASGEPALTRDEISTLINERVAAELARQLPATAGEIPWQRVATVAEAEAAISNAKTPVLLDFTGPSCLNCQIMEKTVYRTAAVRRALHGLTLIRVDTDPPHDELAAWQQSRFHSQERPLYVRIDAKAATVEQRWSRVFSPNDAATMGRFTAFLESGASGQAGAGTGNFWLLALLGGLVTLLMPCTYPMIPFTVNFFAKQAAGGRRLLPLALFYGAGIVACFVGLGVLITGVFGANLATVAGHPLTNLVIAAVFVLFGLSLLGVVWLHIPGLGGGRGGYLGALLMGLTFAATAFTCTAPFAGSVLASAVATGTWVSAVAGMAVYGLAIAVPFVLLALSPRALASLPRAGAWMNEVKVAGGLIELAAALKFLVIADHAWGWGVFGRTLTLVLWSAIALVLALYLLGLLRWEGDEKIEHVALPRVAIGIAFAGLAVWFAAGVSGLELGAVEGLFP